jgi:N-glycosylase/DNA lyase
VSERATPRQRLEWRVRHPFELRLALFGHGWIDLAPHRWHEAQRRFTTVLTVGARAVDVELQQRGERLVAQVGSDRPLGADGRATVKLALRRMLRLDHDFSDFWARCRQERELAWVARRGGGRLLASATLFEDLLKLLFTTNCSWAATRLMTQRLVDAIGAAAPSGRRAFPSAAACARQPERFWRDVVRAGYRGRAARELAEGFASGALRDERFVDPALPTGEVRERLLALHGFGPYAAGQALRLLGRHDDLALDSWCRAKLARLLERPRPPSDRAIERRYSRFGGDRGLVLWMELTADWHRDGVASGDWS